MSRVATTLFIGVAIGAVGALLVRRLQEYVANNDPDTLIDRLSQQVDTLERRFGADELAPSS